MSAPDKAPEPMEVLRWTDAQVEWVVAACKQAFDLGQQMARAKATVIVPADGPMLSGHQFLERQTRDALASRSLKGAE